MNPQPKPSFAPDPMRDVRAADGARRRVPAIAPGPSSSWPVELEVEPWRP